MIKRSQAPFTVLIGHLDILFCKMPVCILPVFLLGCLSFSYWFMEVFIYHGYQFLDRECCRFFSYSEVAILTVSFDEQKFLIFNTSQSNLFSRVNDIFWSCLRNFCSSQGHEYMLLYYIQASLFFLSHWNLSLPRADFCRQWGVSKES